MGKAEKLLQRFLSKPKDFTFDELDRLLRGFNYEAIKSGKTSGSRVAFINRNAGHIIRLHKPHPNPELKLYQLDDIETSLHKMGG
ncbi:type II toxin-antitoxin system HicA family toxin [Candidatus Magnetomonas plexicatena]|uniref:type II toxin-antitoxin system HicA family toxin n=1 Tax=Candidatus Magnetomonas plexicatena TaxID=2552947 RepID=UPI001102B05D|nr:type II toxin-antitoxin system HicA family toxin [Nitrospirales bacterium LBB_01]